MPQTRRAKLGQHFLADSGYRRRIADSLPLRPDDLIIEIGPGRGAMTRLLADRAARVLGIELDRTLALALQQEFAGNSQIEILSVDILSADLRALCRERRLQQCFLFGNLPYYITSPILHHVLQFADSIRAMACMVQREVADRITAQPGSRDYGYLSVFVQSFARLHIAFHIPPGAFSPRPKVDSSLVLFEMQAEPSGWSKARQQEFLKFVQHCFRQKRKKLVNNLSPAIPRKTIEAALASLSIPAGIRAEGMSLAQFRALFKIL